MLTSQGLAQKAQLTGRFLKRKIQEYEALRIEIDALSAEANREVNEKLQRSIS